MALSRSDVLVSRPSSEFVSRNLKRLLWLFAAQATLSCGAWAARWEVVPSITGTERYTDNVALVPDAARQSDWITEVTPAIAVAATGPRLRFSGTYAPEAVYYARGQFENQVYQRGNALGMAELAEKLLFLDFGANVDQYNSSLQAPQASSNANDTGNRATVGSYFASPYLRRDVGSDARLEARYTGSMVNSDDETLLPGSLGNRIDLKAASGPAFRLLTWNADYLREDIRYDDKQNDIVSDVVVANAKRLVTRTVGLLARVGYERYEIGQSSEPLEGEAWSVGFDWIPSPRTRLAATAGHRFYGEDYTLDLSHRTRRTTFSIGYNQIITTTRSEFFALNPVSTAGYLNTLFFAQFPDPEARDKAVQDYMARTAVPPGLNGPTNFFTTELFLAKRWQASVGVLGIRNILIANVFHEDRTSLSGTTGAPGAGDFGASSDVSQTGAGFQWTLRITGQSSWNLGGGYTRSEFLDTGRTDRLKYLGMGLSRRFEPSLVGSINYRRQQADSNFANGNYTENAIFATIQKRF